MRLASIFILITSFLLTGIAAAQEAEPFKILTGGEGGTYIQIGRNLEELMTAKSREGLTAIPSNGSLDNLFAVYKERYTPLGIVQSDVLSWVQLSPKDRELSDIAQKTRMVFPLYNEEVHVLARKGIANLRDLEGQRVAIGREGSGTNLTATVLLSTVGVKPGEEIASGGQEAVELMRQGKLDALFYVAGYPVKLFSQEITAEDGFHLLPMPEPELDQIYGRSEIPAGTYPWQGETVPVAAVKAVLMTYEFDRRNAYFDRTCDLVGSVARNIRNNLDGWLTANGHPKWQAVNLEAEIPGWSQSSCVKEGLKAPANCQAVCSAETNPLKRSLCSFRCIRQSLP